MKAYGGVDVQNHIFLTSALAGGEWPASRPGRFTPGDTHWTGGWVDPTTGLDEVEKILVLPGLELRPLGRPHRSQSLYRLRYPGTVRRKKKTCLYYMSVTFWGRVNDSTTSNITVTKFIMKLCYWEAQKSYKISRVLVLSKVFCYWVLEVSHAIGTDPFSHQASTNAKRGPRPVCDFK
jgi:hypothetical protein